MDADQLLQSVPLFQGLDKKHLASLAKLCHERSFGQGEAIVTEGESGIGLFILGSGRVEVLQKRGAEEQRLRTMGAGEVFGEIGLLTDHPRTASVRAVEPATCLVLTAWSFQEALDASPEIAKPLLKNMAQWLVETEDRASARL
jgi:CRP-like cAMP-binding protein